MTAQGDDLTLAEAVPLATVLVQRLLADAGVRSLAIKGPAFVALQVRRPKQSNDVDLLIHPAEKDRAGDVLRAAGWWRLMTDWPSEMDDLLYSVTFVHPHLPSTVDVHHHYPGLLMDAEEAFERVWAERTTLHLAHREVVAPSAPHALVIDTLHRLRSTREERWSGASAAMAEGARGSGLTPEVVAAAAARVGASRTVAPLLEAMGGPVPDEPDDRVGGDEAFAEWRRLCGRQSGWRALVVLARRKPSRLPRLLVDQVLLPEGSARFWAHAHDAEYRSRLQVLGLRTLRLREVLRAERRSGT